MNNQRTAQKCRIVNRLASNLFLKKSVNSRIVIIRETTRRDMCETRTTQLYKWYKNQTRSQDFSWGGSAYPKNPDKIINVATIGHANADEGVRVLPPNKF